MTLLYRFIFAFTISIFLFSCANQQPPPGGPDDKTPPSIIKITPEDQSINFRGNKIEFIFDDYIDRRSFQENFSVSPKPGGEISYDWSSTGVTVEFSRPLERNRTYIIKLNRGLRDLNGNVLSEPVRLAFSTGPQIDNGKIFGKAVTEKPSSVLIFAYNAEGRTNPELNPQLKTPDFTVFANQDGSYEFYNLPKAKFRMFAIEDLNANELYDEGIDKIAATFYDPEITFSDSVKRADFLIYNPIVNPAANSFLSKLKSDTSGIFFTNFFDEQDAISARHKFYVYFKENISKEDFVSSVSITDTLTNESFRPVFNWLNDSLVEIFTVDDLPAGKIINFKIDLKLNDREFGLSKNLKIAGKSDLSRVSGEVILSDTVSSPVQIYLLNKENLNAFLTERSSAGEFSFENIPPGNYMLFAFIDKNTNGNFDNGNINPFEFSERFSFYPEDLTVKARWNIEDIRINF